MSEYEFDVFISYSHDDKAWVREVLLPRLEGAGLQVCIDERHFEFGISLLDNIERAVERSRHTLVVLTPAYLESEWAGFEAMLVQSADPAARQGRMIPLLLQRCELPRRLRALTYADFTDPDRQEEVMARLVAGLGVKRSVFVSYHRDADPDDALATQLVLALEQAGHSVAIDRKLAPGIEWAAELQQQIRNCDYMLVLLSRASVQSEMVLDEVRWAYENHRQTGRSRLLPVRVAYREPFPYPLNEILDRLQWALWEDEGGTPRLVQELLAAIAGGSLPIDARARQALLEPMSPAPLPRPAAAAQVRLELPEGTMDAESAFYVERPGDQVALATIARQGVTINIKAPRQMGKSSLLVRLMDAAAEGGKLVAFLDFQLFERSTLDDPEAFYREFCLWFADELDLEDRLEEVWRPGRSYPQLCTRYVGRHILRALQGPVVLAMDEVDSIFDAPVRDDFFGMLRSWHNRRSRYREWRQLDLALVTSTEPYQFIEDLNQSPFNVGESVELSDFSAAQVADLNRRHGSPLSPMQEGRLVSLLHGHPYLTRRALYLVAGGRISAPELFERATEDRGPLGDHLRHHLFRLHGHDDLIRPLQAVIAGQGCDDERAFFRLRGAGLVRREGDQVVPRCQLYADYFRERLHG
jgi:hypothetical protein